MSAQTELELTEALTAHLADEGHIEPGEFVGDWIASVYLPTFAHRDTSSYATIMSNGSLPDHVAVGLLSVALDRVRFLEDEDES